MSEGLVHKFSGATDAREIARLGVLPPRPWLDRIALTEARPAASDFPAERTSGSPPPVRARNGEYRKTPPPQPPLTSSSGSVSKPPSAAEQARRDSPPPLKAGRLASGAMRPYTGTGKHQAIPSSGGVSGALAAGPPVKAELVSNGVTVTEPTRPIAKPVYNSAPAAEDELAGIMGNILASGEQEEKRRNVGVQKRVSREEWYKEIFEADDWLALQPENRQRQIARELYFVHKQVQIRTDFEILDVGCGDGRHALELAASGCNVTGLDLSRSLLERGLALANERDVPVRFIEADMREMNFERRFDLVMCLNSTFGYFEDAENLRVLRAMARALKPGGHLILDVFNRDWAVNSCPLRTWWEGADRVVLEETRFDAISSRLEVERSILREGDPNWEQNIAMRAYAVHELPSLMHVTGLRVQSVSGDLTHPGVYLGPTNRRLLVHAIRERGV